MHCLFLVYSNLLLYGTTPDTQSSINCRDSPNIDGRAFGTFLGCSLVLLSRHIISNAPSSHWLLNNVINICSSYMWFRLKNRHSLSLCLAPHWWLKLSMLLSAKVWYPSYIALLYSLPRIAEVQSTMGCRCRGNRWRSVGYGFRFSPHLISASHELTTFYSPPSLSNTC